jgi:hypothetical protein
VVPRTLSACTRRQPSAWALSVPSMATKARGIGDAAGPPGS